MEGVSEEQVGGELEVVQPRVRDDSHVSQDYIMEGGGSRRGQLPDIPQSVGGCGCCCQGWCEVMVRRPNGVTSWVWLVGSCIVWCKSCYLK